MKAEMKEDYSDIVSIMKGRAAIYEYLYMVFKGEPDKSFIGLSASFLPYFQAIQVYQDSKELSEGTEILKEYVELEKSYHNNIDKLLETLAVQYCGLFLTGNQGVALTESVHTTPERINRQEAWEDVRLFYHIRGFKMPLSFKEPEDHIAMELLFMKSMNALAGDLLEKGDEPKCKEVLSEEFKFINKHMLVWIPSLSAKIYKKASLNGALLYKAAAKLTDGFLKVDEAFLRSFI